MSNILTFAPCQKEAAPELPQIMSLAERRAHLENALQSSLDTADHIMAALDQWDHEAPVIKSRPAPVALAPEAIRLPEPVEVQGPEPEITSTPISEPIILAEVIEPVPPLRWSGAGNIISATGIALFSLVAGA